MARPSTIDASSSPSPEPAGADRHALLTSISTQLGSRREANWIVDHAGMDGAQALANRRQAGEPLQYVLGTWPFRTLDLLVDPRVLIPRPETEQVVGVALDELRRIGSRHGAALASAPLDRPVCVDLGTGSGAIALSLAVEGGALFPHLEVWATDQSDDSLAVAAENLAALARLDAAAAARVRLAQGSWFEALSSDLASRVDLVVANPPYVGESEYPDLDPSVRDWEPRGALVAADGAGGVEGMSAIEAIIGVACEWLGPSGALVVEIAPQQAQPVVAVAQQAGFAETEVLPDLSGRLRALVARR